MTMSVFVVDHENNKRGKVDVDSLVAELRAHEEGAAERLLNAFGDKVYRLALRITRNREDAEEVAQDALWTAARKIES
jgi:DNA-directed RNA polymerase specialized sigma24 family protein